MEIVCFATLSSSGRLLRLETPCLISVLAFFDQTYSFDTWTQDLRLRTTDAHRTCVNNEVDEHTDATLPSAMVNSTKSPSVP
jgi:hypothetical protein